MAIRSEDKSLRDSGSSAMGVAPDGAGVKATIFSAPNNFKSYANGDLAMSQDTGQRAAEQVIYSEDELSIDDLDRIVGGLNSENPSGEGGSPSGEGGYTPPPPPVVHAPDHLPTEINQVEVNVATNHSITGDQAISQIAAIIGSQTDDHQQSIAGAEIASLIGRGIIDATTAMADLHNAVTQTHSLTGEQAAGILAGMVLAQTNTPGEAASIGAALSSTSVTSAASRRMTTAATTSSPGRR